MQLPIPNHYVTRSTDDLPDAPKELIETITHRYDSETPSIAKGSIQGGAEFVRSGFSPTHFPLELLQNADDEQASNILFEFDTAQNQLRVFDDGDGFDKSGAVAVCQQGQSRKDHEKQIGFMGIGFKSLFEVCDRVEIHSNGYHFAFELTGDDTEKMRLCLASCSQSGLIQTGVLYNSRLPGDVDDQRQTIITLLGSRLLVALAKLFLGNY